jgi:hypothetical protein
MWSGLTGGIHNLWGAVVLRMHVVDTSFSSSQKGMGRGVRYWAGDESTPCAAQTTPTMLEYRPDTCAFLLVSWWSSIFTLAHCVYGTV